MNATSTTKRFGWGLASWVGAAALVAAFSGSALAAGITSTKHNLSSAGPGNRFSGTDQICVFCHTPHGSDTAAPAPLWNRTLPGGGSFTTYDSLGTASLDGKVLAVGSISLACLSCHDGTQAMNTVINAPGSGLTGPAAWTGGTWSLGSATMGGGISAGALTGVVALGADLQDDHPIGIEYCGGGVYGNGTTGFTGTACNDTDFIGTTSGSTSDGRTAQLLTASINSAQQFWVELGGNTTRSKSDIQLYNRDFTSKGRNANTPSVECGSCHDPHVEAIGSNVAFMRVTAAGSQICLSCHVK